MKELVGFLGTVVLIFLITSIFTYPIMLLANAVLAPGFLLSVFGVSHLGFWHTFGADLLIALTVKSGK